MTLHIEAIELVNRGGALIATSRGTFSRHPHPSGRIWWTFIPHGFPAGHEMAVTIPETVDELERAYHCERIFAADAEADS